MFRPIFSFVAPAILIVPLGCNSKSASYINRPQLTPLMNAAASDDLSRVQKLISQGADVRQRTKNGETALYEAIGRRDLNRDNLPVVDALLRAGADPNDIETFGSSPLIISLTGEYGNPAVTLRLLEAGARVPQDCGAGDSVLSLATQDSSLEVMQALIARKAAVNCQNSPPLYWAALNGEADRVALLLQCGADPNLRVKGTGQTPLEAAITMHSDRSVQSNFAKTRQLLEKAAKKSSADNQIPAN
jgi:ankyrin repeat protein